MAALPLPARRAGRRLHRAGAMFFVLVRSDATLEASPPHRCSAAQLFSLGLLLVVVAGAELFTGNNLPAIAWADGRISSRALAQLAAGRRRELRRRRGSGACCRRKYTGLNGAPLAARWWSLMTKRELPPLQAFFRGMLCNVLVAGGVDGHGQPRCGG